MRQTEKDQTLRQAFLLPEMSENLSGAPEKGRGREKERRGD